MPLLLLLLLLLKLGSVRRHKLGFWGYTQVHSSYGDHSSSAILLHCRTFWLLCRIGFPSDECGAMWHLGAQVTGAVFMAWSPWHNYVDYCTVIYIYIYFFLNDWITITSLFCVTTSDFPHIVMGLWHKRLKIPCRIHPFFLSCFTMMEQVRIPLGEQTCSFLAISWTRQTLPERVFTVMNPCQSLYS